VRYGDLNFVIASAERIWPLSAQRCEQKNSFADALKFTGLASERNAVQDQQAYKNGRQ
jgi:hypothetical protein